MRTSLSVLFPLSLVLCAAATGCGGVDPTSPQPEGTSVNAATAEDEVTDLTVKLDYDCTSPSLGSLAVSVKLKGKTPASAAAGADVKMKKFQASMTIPASDVDELISFGSSLSGSVSTLDVTSTHAKPATINAAGKGLTIPATPLVKGEALTVTFPETVEKVGPWVAGSAGTMTFTGGTIDMAVSVGALDATATCKPATTPAISTTTIK